jgi:hypothetical protein
MRIHATLLLAGLLLASSVSYAGEKTGQTPAPFGAPAGKLPKVEKGFHRIFDGKHLDGWKMAGPGGFKIQPDGSILAEGGMGLLWYTKSKFKDFVLKLDWKAESSESNSGVFVRFPDPQNDPWKPVNEGYEIQICDSGDPLHTTGAIYTFGATSFKPSKPYGEWNSMEIKVVGTKYTVTINGKTVCEYTGDRSLEGYVGVQNHEPSLNVAFRNIRIREL